MYKPSTYLLVTYFRIYIYLYMIPISYTIGYQGKTKY